MTIIRKTFRIARGTALALGLAVILALLLGAASMAFAKDGDPWLLGRSNVATAITSLGGKLGVNGPMVRIINNNADKNDTALDLRVQSGEAPMRVNSTKKVANLNADRLDDREASSFATGVNGKATNADKLDSIDSTGFYRSGSKVADSDKLDGLHESAFLRKTGKAADSDKLDNKDSSAFAGTGMSDYDTGTTLEGCSEKVLAHSEISPSRPALVYASGVSVYEPGGGATGGNLQLQLLDAENTTLASGGSMYANGGGNAVPLSAQGVLMSGSDAFNSSTPFEVTPGNSYVLMLVGNATDGCSGSTEPSGSMGYVALSYVLIGK